MNASRNIITAVFNNLALKGSATTLISNHCMRGLLLKRNFKPILRLSSFSREKVCTSYQHRFSSTSSPSGDDVTVVYRHGLPVISLILPSRHERCSFTLRPLMSNVGQFLNDLKAEDKGIDRTAIYSLDGTRVASSTRIEHLLSESFTLAINENTYTVNPPPKEEVSAQTIQQLDDVKRVVAQLYTSLQVDQYYLNQEQDILMRLEQLKTEMDPLELAKIELESNAGTRTNFLMWGGLAVMATQFGILARLTWWEYSWDIMEPVTYFITYGTAIIMYGYFLLTRQEYLYPDARDRQYLRFFHKGADRSGFDVARYNSLQDRIAEAERDLRRIREPMQSHLPIKDIEPRNEKEEA